MKCDASCMCPSRLASLTQSQLDISSVNPSNHYSLYRWNDNCSDFRASRVIVWNQPNDIQQATKVCYEVHVMAHPTTSNPSCNMKDHVYCIQDDNNQMVLQNLRPGCTVSVAVSVMHIIPEICGRLYICNCWPNMPPIIRIA
jgi:hypothetical protein